MPGIREPNLPSPHDGNLRQLVQLLDESIFNVTGERDPDAGALAWAEPSTLFAVADRLTRKLAGVAMDFRNGSAVRRGSEPTGWRGSARAGSGDDVASFAARFNVAGNKEAESIISTAINAHRELTERAMFGTSRMSVEAFIKNNLAAAGLLKGDR